MDVDNRHKNSHKIHTCIHTYIHVYMCNVESACVLCMHGCTVHMYVSTQLYRYFYDIYARIITVQYSIYMYCVHCMYVCMYDLTDLAITIL